MKNHKWPKAILTAAALCMMSFIVFGSRLNSVFVVGPQVQNPQAEERKILVETLRREGLPGAAKLKGHYVADFNPHWDIGLFDMESLTKGSAAVIVGVAGRNLGGHLTQSARSILTNYEVYVQESIKGQVSQGSTIIVGLPGGSVQFEDGSTAELRTPKFEHIKAAGTYTFFLTEVENFPGTYTLTGGPQGLIELVDNVAKSHARDTDPIAKQTTGRDRRSFLEDVRAQAKKWPDKGKCCS